ncbi:WXG100 family type VII secretion target [Streptomyces sp. NBC_01244]|uniref:WXG100 family type VII secretion target n=1 Tax=Streptomyces sp. NBC_01244 TaxID=2903797 RepID=UPI002E151D96|nr:hypothetical protein OG247_16580 [Streptomyces sp. NBC_01244]
MATNFESHTHQQLLAMLASANAETLKARGAQLTDVAAALKEIGESLKDHRATGWEGESATAFQDWVSRTGNATLRLSEYSAEGGKQLTQAGQVVIEVKANMPTYDSGAESNLKAAREYHNDPDAQRISQQAHSKLSSDREQAIQQMTKLAQGYEAAATGMEMAEIPTFPEPPAAFVPPHIFAEVELARSGGDSPGSAGGGGSSYKPEAAGPRGSSSDFGLATGLGSAAPTPTGSTPGPAPVAPDRNIGTGLDAFGPMPNTTLSSAPGGPGPVGPGGGGPGVIPGGFVPSLTLPSGGGVPKPLGGVGRGGVGWKGSGIDGVAGLPPRDSGITGGRPVTSGGPGAQAAGRGMGVGGGMGTGGGGAHGGLGSPMPGRRLAAEPGGVVGGRSVPGGQPFTQGGSGLVRGGSGSAPMSAPMGHGGAGAPASGRRGDGRQGERPDYLAEDEETWQGDGRVVPPVID